MSKKVFLSVGHGGTDSGAVANGLLEKNLNLVIALEAGRVLSNNGVTVLLSRTKDENDSLNEEIRECNAFAPDLAVDIHNNAGGGDGAEAFHHYGGGVGKVLAENILSEIVAIGQNSRGAKVRKNAQGRDYYGFIRLTNAPAVIVECAFLDNKEDVKMIDTEAKQKAMGAAIAKGILKTLGIEIKEEAPENSKNGYLVKVTAGVLNIRKGAGTNTPVVGAISDKGVYTIVEESDGEGASKWGRLKSGAGWISLDYTKKL